MKDTRYKNKLVQGNVGLGIAISYFTLVGCIVSIPLNDIQDYDLVIDYGDCVLKKVQVKTTTYLENGKYKVDIRTSTKNFQQNKSDYLFIVDGDENKYLIPKNVIKATHALALGDKYSQYIV